MPSTPQVPLIMGILNVTPDSFSDGGRFGTTDLALKQAEKLVGEGADILDIGGESSRPGATPVSWEEEVARVMPVIEAIAKRCRVPISIDTTKFEVATRAVDCGATILNDISAANDIRMAQLTKDKNLTICLMHMQGSPQDMQASPSYPQGAVVEIQKFLDKRVRKLKELGIKKENIWIDPGFGFGKTVQQNLDLLRHLEMFREFAGRVLVGTSRKSFLGKLDRAEVPVEARLPGTLASNLWAYTKGASVFRVHDVREMKQTFQTWDAIRFGTSK